MKRNFSRRNLLLGAAGLAGAAALNRGGVIGTAHAAAGDSTALVMIHLYGGYNALFSSADSFSPAGTFGCSAGNIKSLGNGLFIDNATFGTLPAIAQANMAAIGINHGITSHDPARTAQWSNGTRNYALMQAAAMGGGAAIKCAVVGSAFPPGPRPAEGGVSMQSITNMQSTINALGGGTVDPTIPGRSQAAAALLAAKAQSAAGLGSSSQSLVTVTNAYDSASAVLQQPVQSFNYGALASAYGLAATQTSVNSFTAQMVAAELMVLSGANVVIATNSGWDTHGDRDGSVVRGKMNSVILPGLRVFLSRMMAATGRNVTVAILGDFARSLPGSDHARVTSATVFGKKVKVGTAGKVSATVNLPTGSPSVAGFWSFLSSTLSTPNNPFGTNPHAALVLP